jgi:hypothetical protein
MEGDMPMQYYFDLADSLLQDLAPKGNSGTQRDNDTCCNRCGSCNMVLCYADGCHVCSDCGEVSLQPVFERAWNFVRKFSNYKRIHHFHERLSQYLLAESCVPAADMARIQTAFKESKFTTINKTNVRQILRSLKMQRYIEKWLQIIWSLTGASPPPFSARVCMQLDLMFISMQIPFMTARPADRKNFLKYNYVFNRLLQKLELYDHCMFFPLIKSKSKLHALDNMWRGICDMLNWEYTALRVVRPFSIKVC